MANQYHLSAVNEIIVEVGKLVTKEKIRTRFIENIKRFCKMVEDYGQAQQPYSKKLENAEKRIEKFTPKQLEKYKLPNGKIRISLVDVCPPPKGYIKMNYWDNFFVNVPMGTIYRPKEPVNPLLWFPFSHGNPAIQRPATDDEKLMCDYVLLSVIHDYGLRRSTDRPIFSADYKGQWFEQNRFINEGGQYYYYSEQEKFLQLILALEHVKQSQGNSRQDKPTDLITSTVTIKEYELSKPTLYRSMMMEG